MSNRKKDFSTAAAGNGLLLYIHAVIPMDVPNFLDGCGIRTDIRSLHSQSACKGKGHVCFCA